MHFIKMLIKLLVIYEKMRNKKIYRNKEVKTRKECLTEGLTYDTIVGRMEVGLFFMPKIR